MQPACRATPLTRLHAGQPRARAAQHPAVDLPDGAAGHRGRVELREEVVHTKAKGLAHSSLGEGQRVGRRLQEEWSKRGEREGVEVRTRRH